MTAFPSLLRHGLGSRWHYYPLSSKKRASGSYGVRELAPAFVKGASSRRVSYRFRLAREEHRCQRSRQTTRANPQNATFAAKNLRRDRFQVSRAYRVERDEKHADQQPASVAAKEVQELEVGRLASERGGALLSRNGARDNVITTGGGPGIMEAANRGAFEAEAPSIGFNIGLPHEQEPNAYSTPDLTFQFHYFAVRKLHFAMRANALVVFPGGFGTLDELFELLTLIQTSKMSPIPIVLVDRSYWIRVIDFDTLLKEGMVAPMDLDLFCYADDAESTWQQLVRLGIKLGSQSDRSKLDIQKDDSGSFVG